jgi:hypothetical protein
MVGTIVLLILWGVSGWAFNAFAKRTREEIALLKRENLTCAKAVAAQSKKFDESQHDAAEAIKIATDCQAQVQHLEKGLTAVKEKPRMEPKPARVNWRQFRAKREQASEPAEAE